mgnify:CR=1 FL=1
MPLPEAAKTGDFSQNDITKLSFLRLGVYPRFMTELDQFWSRMIESTAQRAQSLGQHDIVDYLRLRAANDAIRSAGITWLFDSVIEIAAEIGRPRPAVTIDRAEPHTFTRGNSSMVGSLLNIRRGVRCLSVEAGWTRTPSDGIMRGGVLAAARLRHFGMSRENADLSLVYANGLPIWHFDNDEGDRRPLRLVDLKGHFQILTGG